MLLAGGRLEGHVVLPTALVDAMFENQIGDLQFLTHESCRPDYSADLVCEPGMTWGFGMALAGERGPGMRPLGSGGWAGAYNAFFWVDRATGLGGLFFTQTLPFYDPVVVGACDRFERAVYGAYAEGQNASDDNNPGQSNENG
jgi:CubicO group peptidase (beta-lactamase class C family)